MPNCPVCNTEYLEKDVESCPNCGWNLMFKQRATQLNLQNQVLQGHENQNEYIHLSLEKRLETIEFHLKLLTDNLQKNLAQHNNTTSDSNKNLQNYVNRKEPQKEFQKSATDILLSIAEAQLVGKYNQNPQKIFTKAIEVIVSESSLSQNNQAVIFEISRRGNYWVIYLEDTNYLVPKNNFRLNQFNYHSFTKIFQCYGYKSGETSHFLLLKPAIISPLSMGKTWELRAIGVLQFDYWENDEISVSSKIPSSTFEEKEIFQKQSQISTNEQKSSDLEQSKKSESISQSIDKKSILPNTEISKNQSLPIHDNIYLNQQEADILIIYNRDPSSLSSKVIEVIVTEESIDELRLGSGQKIIFETKKAGAYWILKQKNIHYLVPKKHLTFHHHQYKTAEALFQFQGYKPFLRQKFWVIKAARVTCIYGDKWQLEEKGILEFVN
ncbi:MAG: hypothetical protein RMX97_09205 [Nostoc sp. DedQUE11]|nr:hypothetical protein [Nostoc sp. DedQUE11]